MHENVFPGDCNLKVPYFEFEVCVSWSTRSPLSASDGQRLHPHPGPFFVAVWCSPRCQDSSRCSGVKEIYDATRFESTRDIYPRNYSALADCPQGRKGMARESTLLGARWPAGIPIARTELQADFTAMKWKEKSGVVEGSKVSRLAEGLSDAIRTPQIVYNTPPLSAQACLIHS